MTKREKKVAKFVKQLEKADKKYPGISAQVMAEMGYSVGQPACPPAPDDRLARFRLFAGVVEDFFDKDCPGKRVMAYFHGKSGEMYVMKGPDGKDGELPEVWTGLLKEMSQ